MPSVQLFVTCLIDALAPEIGRATTAVLERHGCRVGFAAAQACCGQPAHNAGLEAAAIAMAGRTVEALDTTRGPVVVPSGSCADMLIHHVPELLAGTDRAAAAVRVAVRVREFSQFLVDDLGVAEAGVRCDGCTLVYHPSCHGLRNLGIDRQPRILLDSIEGAGRREAHQPEQCCGFGGLFAVEMPDVSAAIMNTKLDDLVSTGAELVVGVDLGCLLHLEGGLRRRGSDMRVAHLAEVLAGEV